MSEPETASAQADLDALRALEEDTSELEHIENLLDRFNVFEAIGFIDQELMHSRFLAFLLDPNESHGLGPWFLDGFLRKVSESTDSVPLPSGGRDLRRTTVRTEMPTGDGRMDILLTDKASRWAMMIENKIATTEHSNQLDRYHRSLLGAGPSWDTGWNVACVYLTPYGDIPSHEAYLPLSYGAVCEVLDGILDNREVTLSSDARMAISHYVHMLRRHIVGDSKIMRLPQRIYEKHKRAFDLIYRYRLEVPPDSVTVRLSQQIYERHKQAFALIYEHRLDVQPQIRTMVLGFIEEHPRLVRDKIRNDKGTYKFGITEWDTPELLTSKGWEGSSRILRFVFHNKPRKLDLRLALGPGPSVTRRRILEMARANPDLFVIRHLPPKWDYLYARDFLDREAYENLDQEEREERIRRHWNEFLNDDLPRIEVALRREAWIWESVEYD